MASIDSLSILITASTASAETKIKALTKALQDMATAINALDVSKFERLSAATGELSQSFSNLKGLGVKEIKAIAKATQSVEQSKGALDPVAKAAENVAEETKEISTNTDMAAESIKKFDATPLEDISGSMDKVSSTLDKTAQKMGAFKSLLAQTKIIIPTEGLEKVDKRINSLTEKIEDLKDRLNFKSQTQADYVNSEEMEKDQEKIEGLINELERLKLKKQELESHGGFKLNIGGAISGLSKTFSTVNKKLDGFIAKIRSAKSHAKESAKATDSFSLSSIKLAKELTRVTKMLKLMVTRMALRKVIQNAIDGFKNLIQYSSETNAAVSMLWNSFRQLGNSVAAAANPLLTALAPVLNYLIQLCIKLVNAINQVISALMGKTTWTKAKKLSDDYGASLDKSNKSAKELKRTILGFDELNVLQDNKDSGSGAGGTSPADMFEDAKIESKWKDLAAKLKKILNQLLAPIKKAWADVGDEVVAAWTGAFKSVKKLLSDIGRDFLEVWNQPRTIQMLKTIFLIFKDIGGIIKYLADGLDKAWNTNKTGKRILEGIRDIFLDIVIHIRNMSFATLEWAKNLNFTPLLEAFRDWVVSMKPVVDAIAGAFEDFYIKVLLPLGKWTIEEGLPELIKVFQDFNEKVDWKGLREKLSDLWDHLEPFAERVGEGLILFIERITDALANFLNSPEFEAFLDEVKDWMDSVDAEEVADGLESICKAIIGFKAASVAFTALSAIAKFIGVLKSTGGLVKVAIVVSVAYAGLKIGGKIGEWLTGEKATYDNFQWWGEGGFFDTVFGDIGTLDDLWNRIVELKDAWYDMCYYGETFVNYCVEIVSLVRNPAATIVELFSRWWNDENVGSLHKTVEELEKLAEESRNASKETDALKSSFGNLTMTVERDTGTISSNMHIADTAAAHAYSNMKDVANIKFKPASDESERLRKDVSQSFDNIKITVEKDTSAVSKSANSISFKPLVTTTDKMQQDVTIDFEYVNDAVSNTNTVMSGQMKEISQTVSDNAAEIEETTDKIKDSFSEDKWTFQGVIDGLKNTFGEAIDAIKRKWNELTSLNGEHDIGGGGKFNIHFPRFFASGGFPDPEDGWFRASHGEMLGKFDNGQSVVANNEQIVDGIRQGVYEAVSMAMSTGQGGTSYINNTIQVDGETIARAVTKGQKSIDRRYSPTMA